MVTQARIRLTHEALPLQPRRAFHIARMSDRPRHTVWMRLRDTVADDGLEGWGEAPTSTPYYGETAESVAELVPRLEEAIARGAAGDVTAVEPIEEAVAAAVGYSPAARAGVSAALHDLLGKRLGSPVWRIWGLDPATAPRSSYTIGLDEPDVVRERVREAAGYPILKIKVGTARDEEILAAVREEAPDVRLRVDANTAWSVEEALRHLPVLDRFGVELLEQPVASDDLAGLGFVRAQSRIPVVADESCRTSADIPELVGHVDGINIKLAKCGGLREALRMVHVARAHDLDVMLGCMLETTLGIAAAVQLAPLADYADLDGAALLADDPFRGPGIEPDGRLRFNEEPGLGVEQRG
ncbi:MAG: dipeptide epimerase [Gemmatimonadota bacterium]